MIMKSIVFAVATAAVLAAAPLTTFAQSSNTPVTRAQVRAELVQLEQAGYNPAGDQIDYPANIQAAEARVHGQQAPADGHYTSSALVRSQAATPTNDTNGPGSVFFGH